MPRVFRDVTASREVDEKAMLRKQVTAEKTANEAVEEQGDGRNGVGKRTGREGNNSGIALTTIHTIARETKKAPGGGVNQAQPTSSSTERRPASCGWMKLLQGKVLMSKKYY
jgi:hypothetical protein